MCKADMTPIVLIPPGRFVSVPMPDFLTTHTCRNFEKLNHWVRTERAVGYGKEKSLEMARKIREQTGSRY
jgi:Mycotoxin biosynthesis protein UstYa